MTKNFLKITFFSFLSLAAVTKSNAAEGGASRSAHKLGFTVGVFSEAFPAFTSLAAHYNLTPNIQLIGAYGSLSFTTLTDPPATISVKTWTGGVKVFPIKWSLSPYAGFFYSKTTANGTFDILSKSVDGSAGLTSMYASFGLDHQARMGFNIGAGVHYMISPTEITDVITTVPHFYIGWYF